MPKKKKNNNISKLVSIVVVFAVFVVGVYFGTNILNDLETNNNGAGVNTGQNEIDTDRYYVGDEILKEGILTGVDKVRGYTQYLETEKESFGIKSRTISLSNYEGKNVMIRGEIEDLSRGTYIVEVSEIEELETNDKDEKEDEDKKDEDKDEEEDIEETAYYYGQDGFYIDFENNTGFTVKEEEGRISILEKIENGTGEQFEEILGIRPFTCEEGSSTQDCHRLREVFATNSFINRNSIEFYNASELNQWYFFNEDIWGYSLSPKNEDELINISRYIHVFDNNKIQQDIQANIENICYDNGRQINVISSFDLDYSAGQIKAEILGQDRDLNEYKCVLDLSLGANITTNLVDFEQTSISEEDSSEDEAEQIEETYDEDSVEEEYTNESDEEEYTNESDEEESSEDTSQSDEERQTYEINTENTQKFESNRGFNVNIPDIMIFAGETVSPTEDFGVSGLSCNYRLNATHWEEEDYLSSDPILRIYHCETELDEDDISSIAGDQNIVYHEGSISEKKFIVEYKDGYEYVAQDIDFE